MRLTPHSFRHSSINCATFLAINRFSSLAPALSSIEEGQGELETTDLTADGQERKAM